MPLQYICKYVIRYLNWTNSNSNNSPHVTYFWGRNAKCVINSAITNHQFDCSIQRSIVSCCRGNLIHLRKENGPACQDPINIIVLTLIAIQFINLVRAQQFFFVWEYMSCRYQEILLSCNCKSPTSAQMRHSSFSFRLEWLYWHQAVNRYDSAGNQVFYNFAFTEESLLAWILLIAVLINCKW